jgi:hypothetical protein
MVVVGVVEEKLIFDAATSAQATLSSYGTPHMRCFVGHQYILVNPTIMSFIVCQIRKIEELSSLPTIRTILFATRSQNVSGVNIVRRRF